MIIDHKDKINKIVKEAMVLVDAENFDYSKVKPLILDIYYHLSCVGTIAEGRMSDRIKKRIAELQRLEIAWEAGGDFFQQTYMPMWLRVVDSIVVKYSKGRLTDIGFEFDPSSLKSKFNLSLGKGKDWRHLKGIHESTFKDHAVTVTEE